MWCEGEASFGSQGAALLWSFPQQLMVLHVLIKMSLYKYCSDFYITNGSADNISKSNTILVFTKNVFRDKDSSNCFSYNVAERRTYVVLLGLQLSQQAALWFILQAWKSAYNFKWNLPKQSQWHFFHIEIQTKLKTRQTTLTCSTKGDEPSGCNFVLLRQNLPEFDLWHSLFLLNQSTVSKVGTLGWGVSWGVREGGMWERGEARRVWGGDGKERNKQQH